MMEIGHGGNARPPRLIWVWHSRRLCSGDGACKRDYCHGGHEAYE